LASAFLLSLVSSFSAPTAAFASPFKVVINEIHYHPADDTSTLEFIELHNFGNSEANLGGWLLTGGVTFVFPPGTSIPGGGYLVLASNPAAVAQHNGLDRADVLGPYTGSLENQGEFIALFSRDEFLASSLEYGDGEPWPETPDGLGPSLERRAPFLDDTDPEAWAASIPVGGTPGKENSTIADDEPLPDGVSPVTIVARDQTWRFYAAAEAPPADWNAVDFDDDNWQSGTAGFGYDRGDFATTIGNMQGNFTSFYARHTFDLSNAAKLRDVRFTAVFDDGFVAYLNGTEIARVNAEGPPGEPIAHDAVAFPTTRLAETREFDISAFRELFQEAGNVLAVHGLNGSIDSRDFTIHPSMTGTIDLGLTRRVSLVGTSDRWHFFRGSVAPPANWNEVDFDPDDWEEGPGGFGYGDFDDQTVLDDMQGNYLTVFIRRDFTVDLDDLEGLADLILEVDYDDGFVAYLNGTEFARSNVGDTGFSTAANGSHEAGSPERFPVPADFLRNGKNVLALQGHNTDLGSSDFSLHATLEARLVLDDGGNPDETPKFVPRDLVINEIATGGRGSGWVELFNPTAEELDISGRRVRLEPATRGDFAIPANTRIPADGFIHFSESQLGFELDEIATLILTTENDLFIDALNPRTTPSDHSTGRFPDGADNRIVLAQPTQREGNVFTPDRRVVINEIHYHPSDDLPGTEFIELHNHTGSAVNLTGWSFTRGVSFTFPEGASIPANAFVVLAENPDTVKAAYDIDDVFGPWEGGLNNDAETLLLRDDLSNVIDRVRYADEGSWPEETDGFGATIELAHPSLDNRHGPAWRASQGRGTPGAANSSREGNPAPVIVGVTHSPVIPTPVEPVRVLASISDNEGIGQATLFWLRDPDNGGGNEVPLFDDGIEDDGIAGNGIFGGVIPPLSAHTIVRFWIEVRASDDTRVSAPIGAPNSAFLYQVEASADEAARPRWRIVMRQSVLQELRSRGRGSDNLLDVTVIANGKAYYNRGIRYRGNSARSCDPLSYRLQFDHDRSLNGLKRINVNGCNIQRQWLGLDFLRRTGIPTPHAWLRRISFNGNVESRIYLRVESVDDQFLERTMPNDADGNLYRGISQANLDFRGEDAGQYRGHYSKRTNEREDDYSDVFDLCRRFDSATTSDEDFPDAIEEKVDVEQWALYFAAFAILGSTENSIVLNNGDDYFLYHRFGDDRWMLLPWDLDSCYDEQEQRLFRPTVPSIVRFLTHPRYASDYWCFLGIMLETIFTEDQINARIDIIEPLFTPGQINQLRTFLNVRRGFILNQIQEEMTIRIDEGGASCDGLLIAGNGDLRLSGLAPGCGTAQVVVNDTVASYDAVSNRWSATVGLDGANKLRVASLDRKGDETHRVDFTLLHSEGPGVPPIVTQDTVLDEPPGTFVVDSSIFIESGATLTIPSGVELFFTPDSELHVEGTLIIDGEADEPVILRSSDCDGHWAGIFFANGSSGNRIAHCEIRGAGARDEESAMVLHGAEVRLENVVFDSSDGAAIHTAQQSNLTASDCEFRFGREGVDIVQSNAIFSACRFHATREAGLLTIGDPQHTVTVERTIFSDCGTACDIAGALELSIDHVTVNNCVRGILINTLPPDLGGQPISVDSSIVWGTTLPIDIRGQAVASVTFTNTSVEAMAGEGNISANPQLVAPNSGDFGLSPRSPCIGTGRDGTDMGAVPFGGNALNQFLLCDSNGDGDNNLTDAVFTLRHLFAQGVGPSCQVSADCNSDGDLNLTDAVFNLNFLFNQGAAPANPYPACDAGSAEECAVATCAE